MENNKGFLAKHGKADRNEDDGVDNNYSLISGTTSAIPVMRGADFVPQVLACLAATTIVTQVGINLAYSAVLLPQLMSPQSVLPITKDQASWIASIVTISTTMGSLLSGPLMDNYGRQTVCKWTCVPLVISWIIIAFVQTLEGVYCGRLLAGLGGGLSTAPLVYISEVAHPQWRPALLCLISVFVSLGILLTYIMFLWLNYEQMALCFAVMSLASFIITYLLPESPYWLVKFRSKKEVCDSVRWLYRRDECFQHQLKCVMDSIKHLPPSGTKHMSFREYFSGYKKLSTIKPILILILIFIFQQISGAYVIIFYAVNMLQLIGGKFGRGISEYGVLVLLGVIRFVMSIFTAFASRKCGRRPMSIVSGLGMAVSALIAAISINANGNSGNLFNILPHNSTQRDVPYFNKSAILIDTGELSTSVKFTVQENISNLINNTHEMTLFSNQTTDTVLSDPEIEDQWLPLVCVLIYVWFSSIGVLVIPWTLIGELPPLSVRGSCGGFMMAFSYIAMFAVIKIFPYVLEVVKIKGMLYAFSFTSFSGALFVFIFLPETRGRSFQEIEAYFK